MTTNAISNDDLITYITEVMRNLPKNYNDDNKKSKNSTWIIVLLIIVIVIVVVILLLYVYNKDKESRIYAQMVHNLYNNQLYLNNQRNAMIDYPKNQESPKVEEVNDEDFYKTVNNNVRKSITGWKP